MAGFQKFPVPRHLTTRAYWPWTPNWKGNLIMISISVTLLSLTVWRYSLIRANFYPGVGNYVDFSHQNAPQPFKP